MARLLRKALLHSSALIGSLTVAHAAWANPTGGNVVAGSATIAQPSPEQLTITQSSNRAIIDWTGFDIAPNETTTFVQPGSSSVTLNRVDSATPSLIQGGLEANGRVYLVNPNGVVFGEGARVDVGGLVATTADIGNDSFMAGVDRFDRPSPNPNATIINNGTITIRDRGLGALVAPGVANSGVIDARLGQVELAAGTTFAIDPHGDGLVSFAVDGLVEVAPDGTSALVENSGLIQGASVRLTAAAVDGIVDNVIDMTGVIEARTLTMDGGRIVLDGGDTGGVSVAGTLDAAGTAPGAVGGTVEVLGQQVALQNGSRVVVSGDVGAGTALIGGSYRGQGPQRAAEETRVAAGARIEADAITNGDGGTVVVWSEGVTQFNGFISARGGAEGGNGGLVETSGHQLGVAGTVDASSPRGDFGLWLLDPTEVWVVDDPSEAPAGEFYVLASSISGSAADQSFIGYTDVTILGAINKTAGDLSFTAGDGITVDAPIVTQGDISFTVTDLAGQAGVNASIEINQDVTTSNGNILVSATGDNGTAGGSASIGLLGDVEASGTLIVSATGGNGTTGASGAATIQVGLFGTDLGNGLTGDSISIAATGGSSTTAFAGSASVNMFGDLTATGGDVTLAAATGTGASQGSPTIRVGDADVDVAVTGENVSIVATSGDMTDAAQADAQVRMYGAVITATVGAVYAAAFGGDSLGANAGGGDGIVTVRAADVDAPSSLNAATNVVLLATGGDSTGTYLVGGAGLIGVTGDVAAGTGDVTLSATGGDAGSGQGGFANVSFGYGAGPDGGAISAADDVLLSATAGNGGAGVGGALVTLLGGPTSLAAASEGGGIGTLALTDPKGTITAGEEITIAATGAAISSAVNDGSVVVLNGGLQLNGDVQITAIDPSAGGTTHIEIFGAMDVAGSNHRLAVQADGDVFVGGYEGSTTIATNGGDLFLEAGDILTVSDFNGGTTIATAGGDVHLITPGPLDITGDINAGVGTISVVSEFGGGLHLAHAEYGLQQDDIDHLAAGQLSLGRAIAADGTEVLASSVTVDDEVTLSGDTVIVAQGDITQLAAAPITAGAGLAMEAGGNIDINAGIVAVGEVALDAGGNIDVGAEITTDGAVAMQAGTNIDLNATAEAGTDVRLIAGGDIGTGDITSGGSLAMLAEGNILLSADLDVGTTLVLQAGDDIDFGGNTTTVNGDMVLEADSPHRGGGDGTGTLTVNTPISVVSGDVTLIAAAFSINEAINAGAGAINVTGSQDGQLFSIGYGSGDAIAPYSLDALVTTGTLTIGQAYTAGSAGDLEGRLLLTAGGLHFAEITDLGDNAALVTSGDITQDVGAFITAEDLDITVGGDVLLATTRNSVGELQVTSSDGTPGMVEFDNDRDIVLDVIEANNITVLAGNITVAADQVWNGDTRLFAGTDEGTGNVIFQGSLGGGNLLIEAPGNIVFQQPVALTGNAVFGDWDGDNPNWQDPSFNTPDGIASLAPQVTPLGGTVNLGSSFQANGLIVQTNGTTTNSGGLEVNALLLGGSGGTLFGTIAGSAGPETAAQARVANGDPATFFINGCPIGGACLTPPIRPILPPPDPLDPAIEPILPPPGGVPLVLNAQQLFFPTVQGDEEEEELRSNTGNEELW